MHPFTSLPCVPEFFCIYISESQVLCINFYVIGLSFIRGRLDSEITTTVSISMFVFGLHVHSHGVWWCTSEGGRE